MSRTFVVTFGVAGKRDTWSANYRADNYAEAEEKALSTLAQNDDRKSYIQRIELW